MLSYVCISFIHITRHSLLEGAHEQHVGDRGGTTKLSNETEERFNYSR